MSETAALSALIMVEDGAEDRVGGLTLLRRACLATASAGARRLVLVGRQLADPGTTPSGVTVERVADLATARSLVSGPCLVARTDHVYDPAVFRAAMRSPATKTAVVTADGIPLFLREPGDWSGGTIPGNAEVLASDAGVVHRADDAASRREAERRLFASLRKAVDPPISRYINRRISLAVTRQLMNLPITPNQMTVVANLIGFAGVWLVAQGTWASLAIGAVLVQLQSILDGCDGEIARLKYQSSRFGEWLDNITDDVLNTAYGVALGFAAASLRGEPAWRFIGMASAAAQVVYLGLLYAQLALVHRSGNPARFVWFFQRAEPTDQVRPLSRPLVLFNYAGRRDVYLFFFMWLSLAGRPELALLWFAANSAVLLVATVLHVASCGLAPASARQNQSPSSLRSGGSSTT